MAKGPGRKEEHVGDGLLSWHGERCKTQKCRKPNLIRECSTAGQRDGRCGVLFGVEVEE